MRNNNMSTHTMRPKQARRGGRNWWAAGVLLAGVSCAAPQKVGAIGMELTATLLPSFAQQGEAVLGPENWAPLRAQTDKYKDTDADWRGLLLRGNGTLVLEESPEGKP